MRALSLLLHLLAPITSLLSSKCVSRSKKHNSDCPQYARSSKRKLKLPRRSEGRKELGIREGDEKEEIKVGEVRGHLSGEHLVLEEEISKLDEVRQQSVKLTFLRSRFRSATIEIFGKR